jgi:CheY-like chemotaxis protein
MRSIRSWRAHSQQGLPCRPRVEQHQAVKSVERQTYDVVLMDVQMPEMDGLQAARGSARVGNAHIVAMTANAMHGDRELCLDAGMDDYLTKPIRVERLVEALNLVSAREER